MKFANIAHERHEKWNGEGYPRALKGDEIHIAGRIIAIADVFDALDSERCYKQGWELNKILEFFEQQKGQYFDPTLIDLMMGNLDQFLEIRKRYRNPALD